GSPAISDGSFGFDELQPGACSGCSAIRELRDVSGIRETESRSSSFLREGQFAARRREIDLDDVAQADLAGGDQVRNRIDQVPFDGAFQMTCAVLQVRTFAK